MKGYEEITNEIISKLQQGTVPWRQTWRSGLASNFVSKQPYRGINVWLLSNHKHNSNYWLTFNQAKQLGGSVNKGEHGKHIIYWQMTDILQKDASDEESLRRIPIMKVYTVFNVEQTTVKIDADTGSFNPIDKAQEIIDGYENAPAIEFGEPCYSPERDIINMPPPTSFDSPDAYYSTLFHEFSHSTGNSTRLNRPIRNHYGSDPYAEEEIVAEMSSSYLSGIAGVNVYAKTIENTSAYIQHWSSRFADNIKLIVSLSSRAQRSSDWILGNRYNQPDNQDI